MGVETRCLPSLAKPPPSQPGARTSRSDRLEKPVAFLFVYVCGVETVAVAVATSQVLASVRQLQSEASQCFHRLRRETRHRERERTRAICFPFCVVRKTVIEERVFSVTAFYNRLGRWHKMKAKRHDISSV